MIDFWTDVQSQLQDIFEEVNRTQTEQQQQIANVRIIRTDLEKQVQYSFEELNGTQRDQQQQITDVQIDLHK
jgi:hypothetical protein